MSRNLKEALKLYLVTKEGMETDVLLEKVREAVKGGVSAVQLREKSLPSLEFYQKAIKLKELLSAYSVPLIINDRVDIAIACQADGVHIGQSDHPADAVRKMIPVHMFMGVSVRTTEQALEAVRAGADYVGVGACFPTTTKNDAELIELESLKEIARIIDVPAVAIGGINSSNLLKLADTDINGVAVVSALLNKTDVFKETKILRKQLESITEYKNTRGVRKSG